jgi:hypothetical protein
MQQSETSLPEFHARVRSAIQAIQGKIRWKPGKDVQHLQTRLRYGHLPTAATIADYETIITSLLNNLQADVYIYHWGQDIYPTLVNTYQDQRWLVMFGLNGVMETAFPPTDPEEYLADPRFQYLGKMEELTK